MRLVWNESGFWMKVDEIVTMGMKPVQNLMITWQVGSRLLVPHHQQQLHHHDQLNSGLVVVDLVASLFCMWERLSIGNISHSAKTRSCKVIIVAPLHVSQCRLHSIATEAPFTGHKPDLFGTQRIVMVLTRDPETWQLPNFSTTPMVSRDHLWSEFSSPLPTQERGVRTESDSDSSLKWRKFIGTAQTQKHQFWPKSVCQSRFGQSRSPIFWPKSGN